MNDHPGPDKTAVAERPWHACSAEEALRALDARPDGLECHEVAARRERFGDNKLPEAKRPGPVQVFLRQFKDPLIYVLLIAGAVSAGIGNFNNAAFIFAVLLINATIGTFQEIKAESSARELEEIVRIRATVQRGGRRQQVDSTELVPGDIVLLEAGASVPADVRLLSAEDLRADESLLTGESVPVDKTADADLEQDTALGDRANIAHAGSSIISGRAKGVVCRTGPATEVGKIAESLASAQAQAPPLVVKLRAFTNLVAIAVLIAISVLSVVQFVKGTPLADIFFLGVALAVSAIPAGLPVAVTVALAIAAHRMAKRNVIVRQLPAVEGLGSCTLIASDKTGTLTENKLTIKRVRLGDGSDFEVGGEGYSPEGDITQSGDPIEAETKQRVVRLGVAGALCNEGEFEIADGEVRHEGDPVDVAFLVFAAKLGLSRSELLEEHPQVAFIPFDSARRFATSFNRDDGEVHAHAKGAEQTIMGMCDGADEETIARHESQLAVDGYRVLAAASGPVAAGGDGDYGPNALHGLKFLGLAALIDPIRAEVPDAVRRCRTAGVEVRMITGDHPATGMAIARQIGIAEEGDEAVSGHELSEGAAPREQVRDARVYARIEPTQKTTIVEMLQEQGHFVAVTGDGVNDAPALRMAHIGVAMGQGGTDVARGAADLILTDDNFASIVNGIEEGRIAYDNVRKVTWLLLSTGTAEVLLFFLAIFTGLPLPLGAVQLLWLNLVTNGIQDVALAFERGEPGVLERPPRPPDQPIVDRQMIEQTLVSGGYIGMVAFGAYYYLLEWAGMGEFDARNLLLLLMVLFENAHCFSCRSERRSLFSIPIRANPLLILSIIGAQGVHIGAMFVPGLSGVLEIEPVAVTTWLMLLPLAASLLVVDEIAKYVRRRMHPREQSSDRPAMPVQSPP